jgi:integrase
LSALVFGELRSAEWAEIDLDAPKSRIPGSKLKMTADHLVPLSKQAVEILCSVQSLTGNKRYVFPGMGRTEVRPMSENTMNSALRAMSISQETHSAHGFRAMARPPMDEAIDQRVDLDQAASISQSCAPPTWSSSSNIRSRG